MKAKLKIALASVLVLVSLFSMLMLTGCEAMTEDADKAVKEFTTALANDDFDKVVELSHPSLNAHAETLRETFADLEKSLGVDFSDGFEYESATGFRFGASVNVQYGPHTETILSYYVTISGVKLELSVSVVNGVNGSGITSCIFKNRVVGGVGDV